MKTSVWTYRFSHTTPLPGQTSRRPRVDRLQRRRRRNKLQGRSRRRNPWDSLWTGRKIWGPRECYQWVKHTPIEIYTAVHIPETVTFPHQLSSSLVISNISHLSFIIFTHGWLSSLVISNISHIMILRSMTSTIVFHVNHHHPLWLRNPTVRNNMIQTQPPMRQRIEQVNSKSLQFFYICKILIYLHVKQKVPSAPPAQPVKVVNPQQNQSGVI